MVNNLTKMAAGLICLFISLTAMAQEQNDTRYLEGAVPLVNGKVIFSHEYSLKGMSQDEFRDKIMDERMRELCFEGWRRIDLIRTDKFVELVKERNQWANESGTIQDFHKRYPIPDTEIQTNDDYEPEDQNPGYTVAE